jgi:hypothetical protein
MQTLALCSSELWELPEYSGYEKILVSKKNIL